MRNLNKVKLFVVVSLIVGLLSLVGIALASEGAHWGYAGETGPDHWHELSEEYALCGSGMEQSPVDIPSSAPLNPGDDITYNYQPTALNILNNGHAIQVNYDEGSAIELDGMTYDLLQFHFHGLSEHTVDRAHMELEGHLVHQNEAGELAVVGFFVTRGEENPAFSPVWDNIPAEEGEPQTVEGITVNVDELLPEERSYYRYNGSLTTPGCYEGVKWIVLDTPVEMSDAQINAFQALYDNNYRPTQPLYERRFLVTEGDHWSYAGETGPDYWGVLNGGEYALCGSGMEQSPVDIPSSAPLNPGDDITYNYQPTALNILNNGHAIQVNYDEGSAMELDGMTYDLLQFHFHGLSEHTVDRAHMELEGHLVHQNEAGELAVVGFFVTRGEENPAFSPVWDNIPAEEGEPHTVEGVTVNVADLLPEERSYYRYNGSLTTPGCNEGVKWIVLDTPVEMSDAQINAFQALYDNNYRPTQPLYERDFLAAE